MIDVPEATNLADLCHHEWRIVGYQSPVTMEWEYCCHGWSRRGSGVVTVQRKTPGGYELLAKLPRRKLFS